MKEVVEYLNDYYDGSLEFEYYDKLIHLNSEGTDVINPLRSECGRFEYSNISNPYGLQPHHASLIYEYNNIRILMDPLLNDSFGHIFA